MILLIAVLSAVYALCATLIMFLFAMFFRRDRLRVAENLDGRAGELAFGASGPSPGRMPAIGEHEAPVDVPSLRHRTRVVPGHRA